MLSIAEKNIGRVIFSDSVKTEIWLKMGKKTPS
jgi:hypothetical protein